MAAVAGCTPNELLDDIPCLQCLSDSELIAVIVLALAMLNNHNLDTDLDTLMQDSACSTCMSDKQMLHSVTSILATYAGLGGQTLNQFRESIKCLTCVDPKRIKALLVYLLCQYLPAPA